MPHYNATAIANEFLRRRASETWPKQMRIQKLTYIANGWNLAINGEPLVSEAPEAWDNGPVYTSLWRAVKDYGYSGPNCELHDPFTGQPWTSNLEDREIEVIDHVWRKYQNFSAKQLSDMTHEPGTPWFNAYINKGRNAELDLNEVQQHFIDLALAGRKQAVAV